LDAGISKVDIAIKNTPSASTTTVETKTEIKAGDKDVSALQQLLAKRGFYNGAIDGLKGSQTNAAIASAQRAYGLTPDGIAGNQTIAALQIDMKPSASSPTAANPANAQAPKTISNDDEVANLQNLLADRGFYTGAITGVRGPRTKDAIIAAQKAYGLTPDGIAGAKTITALESGAPRKQIAANNSTNNPTNNPANNNVTPTIRVETKPQVTATPQTTTPQTPTPQAAAPQSTTPQPQVTPQPKPQESPAPQAKATPAPTSAPAAADPQVVALQNLLVKRGFYNGKVDGVLSGETRNAIVRAQNFYTITPADGSPSNKLVDSLSKDTFISEGN
jgi:peptidoglycan hydrolase-like protein with peptidoglycan-binding domain